MAGGVEHVVVRRYLLPLGVAALLVTAGCALPVDRSTATSTPDLGVDVRVANEANATTTFEVSVVAGPLEAVTLRRTDGSTETMDDLSAGEGITLFEPTDTAAVVLPDRARQAGSYQLATGSSVAGPVGELPDDPVVVVVVKRRGRVLAWLTASCGDAALEGVEVTMRDGGPGTGLQCGGFGVETGGLSGPPA